MITSNLIFFSSITAIVMIGAYLTVTNRYRTGLVGAVGFMLALLGYGSMLLEIIIGVEFKILPQVSIGTLGIALFLIQHVCRTRLFQTKKHDSRLGETRNFST